MDDSSKFKSYFKFWAFCSMPIIILSFLLNPDKVIAGEYTFLPQCIFKVVTAEQCFGCGFTRSMCLFAHGRFEESLSFNKMGSVIFVLILLINVFFVSNSFIKKKKITL